MTLRNMTADDYDEVYALWRGTPGMGLNDQDDSKAGIAKYLDRNPRTCFVAENGGKIIGVILSGHDGRRGYIYHTAVDGGERRRGVGTALVSAAADALKREGIHKIAMVVFGKNEKGNAFWARRGFAARDDLVYRDKALTGLVRLDT